MADIINIKDHNQDISVINTKIGDENSGLIKELNDIKGTELGNLNAAIQTLETLIGLDEIVGDKNGLPSGDANIIDSINRIDNKTPDSSGGQVVYKTPAVNLFNYTTIQQDTVNGVTGYYSDYINYDDSKKISVDSLPIKLKAYSKKKGLEKRYSYYDFSKMNPVKKTKFVSRPLLTTSGYPIQHIIHLAATALDTHRFFGL